MVAVVKLNNKKAIKETKVFKIDGLSPGTKLELGYFVKIKESVIFINN